MKLDMVGVYYYYDLLAMIVLSYACIKIGIII